MGRWSGSGKSEADSLKKIETSFLKKHGYFCGWKSGTITWTHGWSEEKSSVSIEVCTLNDENYLRIHYTQTEYSTDEKRSFDYKIPLTTSSCWFGGKRYWFTCPWYKSGIYCGKRVGVLYKDGDYFACRHCYDLTYESRKENRRSGFHVLFSVLRTEKKIDELQERIKRPYYAGRPTRKQRRLERLYQLAHLYFQKSKNVL